VRVRYLSTGRCRHIFGGNDVASGGRRPSVRTLRRPLAAVAVAALALAGGCTAGPGGPSAATPTVGYSGPAGAGPPTSVGAKWDWSRTRTFGPYLHALSGGATFYEAVLCDIEPRPGRFDWANLDEVSRSTRRLGIKLMLKVRIGTCWATDGHGGYLRGHKSASAFPADLTAYRTFVRTLVARYAPATVHEYAVENEANDPGMWNGTAAQYSTLVHVAGGVIRATDPKSIVVDSGISSTSYGVAIASSLLDKGQDEAAVLAYQRYYAARPNRATDFPPVSDAQQLQAALRGTQAQRDLAFVGVTERLARERAIDVRQIHFYEPWQNVPALLDYLDATTPPQVPLEAWEVGSYSAAGAGSTTAAVRADDMAKKVTLLLAGGLRRVVWLPLAFDPTGRHANEPRYGLLDPDGTARLSGREFLLLLRLARNRAVPVHRLGLVGAAFERHGRTSMVLWSGSGSRVIAGVPAGSAIDPLGSPPGGAPARQSISVGSSPVLVTIDGHVDSAVLHLRSPVA
jgi:hypothetical protein